MCSAENKGDQEFEKSISRNIIDHQVYRNWDAETRLIKILNLKQLIQKRVF